MEAATKERELNGEKAQRIVDAMRESVAKRGAAASTFEQVAGEAGVSRGLLHYYFGTKERLLVEVVRRDAELRVARLDEMLEKAETVDAVLDGLVASLTDMTITYLVDGYYNPADELGVAWDDPEIGADWGVASPTLSARDRENPKRSAIPPHLVPRSPLRS